MDKKQRRDLLRTLREIEKSMRAYRKYRKKLARFIKDFLERVSTLTWDYFSKPVPNADLIEQCSLDEDTFRIRFIANGEIEYFGNLIFDQLCDDMEDFSGDEVPPGRKLNYKKIEYSTCSREECERKALKMCQQINLDTTVYLEQLCQRYLEDTIAEKYYDTYEILLHKELKKMAVEYFPEIMEISGTGLLEVDYMLYLYARCVQDEIFGIIFKKD